jgi:hypothetical protein
VRSIIIVHDLIGRKLLFDVLQFRRQFGILYQLSPETHNGQYADDDHPITGQQVLLNDYLLGPGGALF